MTEVNLVNCQRCGLNHNMKTEVLLNPADEYKWWGMCENTNQPVLVCLIEEFLND